MADWTLPLESTEEERDYNVEQSKMENKVVESRLISAGVLIGIKCKSPALTYTQLQFYIAFYNSKYGSLTSFTFTSRIDGQDYVVQFVRGSFKTSHSGGVFQCEFALERIF